MAIVLVSTPMRNAKFASVPPGPPRATCTAIAAACPLLLLSLYGFLASDAGGKIYERLTGGDFSKNFVGIALLILIIVGIMMVGLVMAVRAVLRGESPVWLTRVVLAVNAAIALAALSKFL